MKKSYFRALGIAWIIAVSMTFSGHSFGQTLLNGGFEENKVDGKETNPLHWTFDHVGGRYSSQAHSGEHALEISNWYFWSQGWACYGFGEGSWQCAGEPIAFNPSALTGWYQYIYGDNQDAQDSAVCVVIVYSKHDTIAYQSQRLGPSKSYVPFFVPIRYRNPERVADTVSVQFWSSQSGVCGKKSGGKCLYLTVDDLELTNVEAPSTSQDPQAALILWTATDVFEIQTNDPKLYPCTVKILNEKNRVVFERQFAGPSGRIVTNLKKGTYQWEVVGASALKYVGSWNLQ